MCSNIRGAVGNALISATQRYILTGLYCHNTGMKIWQLLCCMVLALPTIDKDRSFCHQSATPSLRDTKFYWLTFITGELSSFSVTMTNLALHYLRPAQIKNGQIFTSVWWVKSRNSDFIFSRRNDQIQPLPLNDDEIRWSRVKLEFFVAKNHAAAAVRREMDRLWTVAASQCWILEVTTPFKLVMISFISTKDTIWP